MGRFAWLGVALLGSLGCMGSMEGELPLPPISGPTSQDASPACDASTDCGPEMPVDQDGDGLNASADCDDRDPGITTVGFRTCRNDCGGGVQECLRGSWTPCDTYGAACSLPNAWAECRPDQCLIVTCGPEWKDCDGIHDNGCETPVTAACPSPEAAQ